MLLIDPCHTGQRLMFKERIESALTQSTDESITKWTTVALKAISRKPLVTVMLMRLTPVLFGLQNGGSYLAKRPAGNSVESSVFHEWWVRVQPYSPSQRSASARTF